MCLFATGGPAGGEVLGLLHIAPVSWIGGTFIERHYNIRTQVHLDLDGLFWADKMLGTVQMGAELNPLLRNAAQGAKAEHLETAAVGENGPLPAHKAVQPT